MDAKDYDADCERVNRRDRDEEPQGLPRRGGDLEIRLAEAHEADAISRILHAAFLEYKPFYTVDGFAATALNPLKIQERLREGPVWIASLAGQDTGTVAAVRNGEAIYIRGMAVLPSARGSGAGSQLLEAVERWARDQGVGRLFLSTTPFLHSAIRLYERSGFIRMEEDPQDLFGTPLFTMEKALL